MQRTRLLPEGERMSRPDFRPFVPAVGQSRIAGSTPREHTHVRLQAPRAQELLGGWAELAKAPFTGITTDGQVMPKLFSLRPCDAPTAAMVAAAHAVLGCVSPEERATLSLSVQSNLWREWQNTELYVESYGLRLDEVSDSVRESVMEVLRASLSAKGFEAARAVMRLNRFLGDLVGSPAVLGEWSYTFCLLGAPSHSEPWGWQLFGHHLTLSCFVLGRQMVLSPSFLGNGAGLRR